MKLSECKRCSLHKSRTKVVMPLIIGIHPQVMFTAESPGKQEDLQGLPLRDSGRNSAGYWHWKIAKEMEVDKSCICLNTVQCRPVTKDGRNGKPTMLQIEKCSPWIKKVYNRYKPRLVILYGAFAVGAILGFKSSMKSIVGRFYETSYFGETATCFVMYHPSTLSYDNPKYKPIFTEHIKIVRNYLHK